MATSLADPLFVFSKTKMAPPPLVIPSTRIRPRQSTNEGCTSTRTSTSSCSTLIDTPHTLIELRDDFAEGRVPRKAGGPSSDDGHYVSATPTPTFISPMDGRLIRKLPVPPTPVSAPPTINQPITPQSARPLPTTPAVPAPPAVPSSASGRASPPRLPPRTTSLPYPPTPPRSTSLDIVPSRASLPSRPKLSNHNSDTRTLSRRAAPTPTPSQSQAPTLRGRPHGPPKRHGVAMSLDARPKQSLHRRAGSVDSLDFLTSKRKSKAKTKVTRAQGGPDNIIHDISRKVLRVGSEDDESESSDEEGMEFHGKRWSRKIFREQDGHRVSVKGDDYASLLKALRSL